MISRTRVSRWGRRLAPLVFGTLVLAGAARAAEFVTPGEMPLVSNDRPGPGGQI